jgi:hypothetical protein
VEIDEFAILAGYTGVAVHDGWTRSQNSARGDSTNVASRPVEIRQQILIRFE